MIFNGRQTLFNIILMNRMLAGLDYKPFINTTINEKLNILVRKESKEKYPKLNTLIIGSYDKMMKKELTRLKMYQDQHNPTDAALFNQIPFFLRKPDELDKYALRDYHVLRKRVIIDDEEYIAAYGRKIERFEHKEEFTYLKYITDEYANIYRGDINHLDSLDPKPNVNLDMRFIPDTYINDFIKTYIYLDDFDINELFNVFEILKIEDPIINEMAVCAGKWVPNVDFIGNEYIESIETQIMYFLDSDIDLTRDVADRDYIDFYVEVGGQQILRIDK